MKNVQYQDIKNSVKKLYNLKYGKGYGMNKYKYYSVIDNFYKGMSTSKGVPYINHINEGINHLENMKVDDDVINAFILHPFVQCVNLKGTYKDCLLTEKELEKHINIFEIEPEIAFELLLYRKYANSYLCRETTDNFSIHDAYRYLNNLINYQTTVKMLIADKLQNFKDFLLYRQDHPRKEFLNQYFTIWLNILANISESTSIRDYIDIELITMNQPKTKKEYL